MDHIQNLRDIRDHIQAKLSHDTSALLGLQTLLNASKEADTADLKFGKMNVNWWKDCLEKDVEEIDNEVNYANKMFFKCWNNNVEKKLKINDKEKKTNLQPHPETTEVKEVLSSIRMMRGRMQAAVGLLRAALEEVEQPATLLQLGLCRVTECKLTEGGLPATLRCFLKSFCFVFLKIIFLSNSAQLRSGCTPLWTCSSLKNHFSAPNHRTDIDIFCV